MKASSRYIIRYFSLATLLPRLFFSFSTSAGLLFFAMAKMVNLNVFLLIVASFIGILYAASADKEILVLLDNLSTKETHSIFFRTLQGERKSNSPAQFLTRVLA